MDAELERPLAARLDLSRWPGSERRAPPRSSPAYLTLSSLAAGISETVDRTFAGRTDLRVLDIGCGDKPYLPLVAARAVEYTGMDTGPGRFVDDIGRAEELPYEDGSFDLVLCTQVLEHVDEPSTAVREVHRVLRPGGLALLSTHGVHIYHPSPVDLWRWTHAGLERLVETNGDWTTVEVTPNGNVIACFAGLFAWYLDALLRRLGQDRARRAALTLINATARWLDDRYPATVRVPEPGSLSANYLVAAVRTRARSSSLSSST